MGRAMPSPLARTSSDLLTNWSHESSTNWTTSARSRAERHGRRVHPAASQTPHAQYAPTACVGRMQATRQACEPPDGCDTRPMDRGHRRTHEGQGNRHDEGAPPSSHRRDGPCCGDFWIFGEHLGSNAPRWPRTTPWLEVWLKVGRSGRGCVPSVRPAAGGVEAPVDARRPLPGRHDVDGGAQISEGR